MKRSAFQRNLGYQQSSGKEIRRLLTVMLDVHYLHLHNVETLTIDIKGLAGRQVLGGSIPGRQLFGKLISHVASGQNSEASCFLDFAKIQLATGSHLRESILAFQRWGIDRKPPLFAIVANANSEILEELEFVLADCGGAIWVCTLERGRIGGCRAIGRFDQIQRQTFELVRERGEVDAPTLARETINGRKTNQTAWNNRLAALASRGLLTQRQQNKTKVYRLLLEV